MIVNEGQINEGKESTEGGEVIKFQTSKIE